MRNGLAFLLAAGLAACGESDRPDDQLGAVHRPEIARIMPAEQALNGAFLPRIDPAPLNDAEIRAGIGTGARCEFRYTRSGPPVLAARMRANEGPSSGIVKVNGNMVALEPLPAAEGAAGGSFVLGAGPIRIAVTPARAEEESRDADLFFQVGEERRLGYRGYLRCVAAPAMTSERR